MRKIASHQGQNVIEYVLLVTAVSIVLIGGVLVKGGVFVRATNSVLNFPSALIQKENARMGGAGPGGPGCTPGCSTTPCGQLVTDDCGNPCMGQICPAQHPPLHCLDDAHAGGDCTISSESCECM